MEILFFAAVVGYFAIGCGLCSATGTLIPPIVTGNAGALVATTGAKIVLADCGMTGDARGLARYLAEREKNAQLVDAKEFRLE